MILDVKLDLVTDARAFVMKHVQANADAVGTVVDWLVGRAIGKDRALVVVVPDAPLALGGHWGMGVSENGLGGGTRGWRERSCNECTRARPASS